MFVHATTIVGLKCSFHFNLSILLLLFTLWAAKLVISFGLTKKYPIFSRETGAFLYFLCIFAAANRTITINYT